MIYFGFDEVVYGWPRYFDLCNSFELRNAATPEDEPTTETLNRWRVESPKGFAWVVHTTAAVNELLVRAYELNRAELDEAMDAAIAETEERAHALAAKAILIATPPELPPSDISRGVLRQLGARMRAKTKRVLIWESSGLWTAEDAQSVAADAGFVYVVDPFMLHAEGVDIGSGAVAAFRITERAAARRQFDGWEMRQLVEWASGFERTFVLLAGRFKIAHAKELSLLLRDETP